MNNIVKFSTIEMLKRLPSMVLCDRQTLLSGGACECHEFKFLSKDSGTEITCKINTTFSVAEVTIKLRRVEEISEYACNDKTYINDIEDFEKVKEVIRLLIKKTVTPSKNVSSKVKFQKFLKDS